MTCDHKRRIFDECADCDKHAWAIVDELTQERDEARDWVRRMHRDAQVLTCVYCGHAYPPGTPASGSDALTAHIRVCEKHPMRQCESKLARVREVLDVCIDSIAKTTIKWIDPVSVDRWNTARAMLQAVREELDRGGPPR